MLFLWAQLTATLTAAVGSYNVCSDNHRIVINVPVVFSVFVCTSVNFSVTVSSPALPITNHPVHPVFGEYVQYSIYIIDINFCFSTWLVTTVTVVVRTGYNVSCYCRSL